MSHLFSAFQKTGRRPWMFGTVIQAMLLLVSLLWLLTPAVQGETAAVDQPFSLADLSTEMALAPTAAITETGFPLNSYYSWVASDNNSTSTGLAWGDVDGDGDLDLAIGYEDKPNKLYLNVGNVLQSTAAWQSATSDDTTDIAWGDVDGDGDLDLAVANDNQPNKLYLNVNGMLQTTAVWQSAESDGTMELAWGDFNGDGYLDLAVANWGNANRIYTNNNGTLESNASWGSAVSESTWAVAWGDIDNDGDLDLVFGNGNDNKFYRNDKGTIPTTAEWTSLDFGARALAWGDIDQDGDLDLVVGDEGPNKIYFNGGGTLPTTADWYSNDNDVTNSIALADMDADGDLDLLVGNDFDGAEKAYLNENGQMQVDAVWASNDHGNTQAIAIADVDGDGDLDLAAGFYQAAVKIYFNQYGVLQTDNADIWQSADSLGTLSVAWGDVDNDGDLDLVTGNSNQTDKLYLNTDGILQANAVWDSNNGNRTNSVQWGDIDNDGYLELVFGDVGFNKVYDNRSGQLDSDASWLSADSSSTVDIALADVDGDGDLDLAAANNGANRLYLNTNNWLETSAIWTSNDNNSTSSVAWGDVDGDGDPDLAVGNFDEPNKLYLNENGMLQTEAVWASNDEDTTFEIAWGDIDGDGDLDLVAGNYEGPAKIYFNENGMLQVDAGWSSSDSDETLTIALGDVDGDGDLDLAVGNEDIWTMACSCFVSGPNKIYLNENGVLQTAADRLWTSGDTDWTRAIAWADVDNDGDLDLAAANSGLSQNKLYVNGRQGEQDLLDNHPSIDLRWPVNAPQTDNARPTQLITETIIPISYSLFDYEDDLIGRIEAEYSLNGGGQWLAAVPTTATQTTDLLPNGGPYDGLVGYWPLDEGAGTAVYDKSAYGQHGSLQNNPEWVTTTPAVLDGFSTHALSFNGTNYVDLGNPAGLSFTGTIAIAAWVNTGATDGIRNIVAHGYNTPPAGELFLRIENGEYQVGSWDGASHRAAATIPPQDLNTWVHLAGVYDGTHWRLYRNGVLVASAADATGAVLVDSNWAIGARGGGTERFFQGQIDEVRIYKRPLSAAEVQQLANPTPTHTFYWDTFASGFFGQSDNVVFRLVAYPQPNSTAAAGTYLFPNQAVGPFQRPYASAATLPFRVRGTQVQVFSETLSAENGVPHAIVFQQANSELAQPLTSASGTAPYTTDHDGYLSGRGQLALGDKLFAALPMTTTYRTPPQLIFSGTDGTAAVGLNHAPTQTVTVEFWLLPTADGGTLFSLGGLTLSNPADLTVNGVSTGMALNDGFAHHVALSWQESNHVWVLYVDGQTAADGTAAIALDNTLTFGDGYHGSLDEIRLWNTVRTSQQISDTLLTPLTGNESGLVGYWPVEDSDTNAVNDASGHANPLFLAGGVMVYAKPLYTVYHTSGMPTPSGVAMFEVTAPGVQQLVVSKDNPLMLFDLDVSLEWDASGDPDYLNRLEQDIGRASEVLYDLTNGQVAFGQINVYQGKALWEQADIQVYANNNQRPNANLGGIVTNYLTDTLKTGEVVGNAFLPGKIRIGATWNRYGNPGGTIGEDWPRVLAHEFGHYGLFLLDNYLGVEEVNGSKIIVEVDCAGSAMTDAYRQDYSEFLSEAINYGGYSWLSDGCQKTLAEDTTGRSDWETIQRFYPFLKENIVSTQAGPTSLPLAVTQVTIHEPENDYELLTTPVFYLNDTQGNLIPFTRGEGQAYLYQSQGTADLEDDEVLYLGSPSGPLIHARGAAVGDRLCVFDNGHHPARVGCLDNLQNSGATLTLLETPFWQPEITVQAVNSTTLAVTVVQTDANNIHVQLFPSYRPTETVKALTAELVYQGNGVYTGQFQFPLTVLDGFVRIWEEGEAGHESMSRFANAPGWDGNTFVGFGGNTFVGFTGNRFIAWGGNTFVGFGGNTFVGFGGNTFVGFGSNTFVGFGGNTFVGFGGNTFVGFNAPLASPDGQVILYNVDNILAGNVASSLQVLANTPQLPAWLTPIGQVYRYSTQTAADDNLVIQFQYLQRELPAIEESQLRIYYLDEAAQNADWQRLEDTTIDDFRNLASAKMPGEGLYALVATVELPRFYQGWNNFGYPINEPRPVAEALASIDGAYTSVYHYDAATRTWLLYDATVVNDNPAFVPLVNTLEMLETNKGYWLYATADITAYLGVAGSNTALDAANQTLPPATYYGYVQPHDGFQPTAGMIVTAWVEGAYCGQGILQLLDGQLAYIIQIEAENSRGECGTAGKLVTFQIDGRTMAQQPEWDHSQAQFLTLDTNTLTRPVYLPVITRP